jgi:pentatricopeptide repeat protein
LPVQQSAQSAAVKNDHADVLRRVYFELFPPEGRQATLAGEASEGRQATLAGEASEGRQATLAGEASEGRQATLAGEASEGRQATLAGEASEEERRERAREMFTRAVKWGSVGVLRWLEEARQISACDFPGKILAEEGRKFAALRRGVDLFEWFVAHLPKEMAAALVSGAIPGTAARAEFLAFLRPWLMGARDPGLLRRLVDVVLKIKLPPAMMIPMRTLVESCCRAGLMEEAVKVLKHSECDELADLYTDDLVSRTSADTAFVAACVAGHAGGAAILLGGAKDHRSIFEGLTFACALGRSEIAELLVDKIILKGRVEGDILESGSFWPHFRSALLKQCGPEAVIVTPRTSWRSKDFELEPGHPFGDWGMPEYTGRPRRRPRVHFMPEQPTPFVMACAFGQLALARYLFARFEAIGASPAARGAGFGYALANGHVDIARWLAATKRLTPADAQAGDCFGFYGALINEYAYATGWFLSTFRVGDGFLADVSAAHRMHLRNCTPEAEEARREEMKARTAKYKRERREKQEAAQI